MAPGEFVRRGPQARLIGNATELPPQCANQASPFECIKTRCSSEALIDKPRLSFVGAAFGGDGTPCQIPGLPLMNSKVTGSDVRGSIIRLNIRSSNDIEVTCLYRTPQPHSKNLGPETNSTHVLQRCRREDLIGLVFRDNLQSCGILRSLYKHGDSQIGT